MDIFTQRRFTVTLIVILVTLNVGAMSLLWLRGTRKPGPPPPPGRAPHDGVGSASLLKKELGLSDRQFENYLVLREQHKDETGRIRDEIYTLKKQMFNQLFEAEPDTVEVERIIQLLAEKEMTLERVTFAHLEDLKELCGQGQREKLQKLLDEFFRATGSPPQRSGHRPPIPE